MTMRIVLAIAVVSAVLIVYAMIEKRINQHRCPCCGYGVSKDALDDDCPSCGSRIPRNAASLKNANT